MMPFDNIAHDADGLLMQDVVARCCRRLPEVTPAGSRGRSSARWLALAAAIISAMASRCRRHDDSAGASYHGRVVPGISRYDHAEADFTRLAKEGYHE